MAGKRIRPEEMADAHKPTEEELRKRQEVIDMLRSPIERKGQKMTPRAYTEEETRAIFLQEIRDLVAYWAQEDRVQNCEDRLNGLAFSILALLDGSQVFIPAFRVSPRPHPDDQAFHEARGENWHSPDVDIAGALHEEFHKQ